MSWDAAGAIGEIIGAVAVVATLAFLAVQLRQSQRAQRDANVIARSAAADKAYDQFAEHRRILAADSEATRIWIAGCARKKLDEVEAERFRQLAINYLTAFVAWEQRAAVLALPGMADLVMKQLEDDLDRHPGLRPYWRAVASVASARVRKRIGDEALSSGESAESSGADPTS